MTGQMLFFGFVLPLLLGIWGRAPLQPPVTSAVQGEGSFLACGGCPRCYASGEDVLGLGAVGLVSGP